MAHRESTNLLPSESHPLGFSGPAAAVDWPPARPPEPRRGSVPAAPVVRPLRGRSESPPPTAPTAQNGTAPPAVPRRPCAVPDVRSRLVTPDRATEQSASGQRSPRAKDPHRLPHPAEAEAGRHHRAHAPIASWYCAFLLNYKRYVTVAWLVVAGLSAFFASRLVPATELRTPQAGGSAPPAVDARERLFSAFPNLRGGDALVVLRSLGGEDLYDNDTGGDATSLWKFSHGLNNSAARISGIGTVEGYWLLPPPYNARFVSSRGDNSTTYLRLQLLGDDSDEAISKWLLSYIASTRPQVGGVGELPFSISAAVLSTSEFVSEAHRTANREIRTLLAGALPMTLAAAAFFLRSLRLVIIPCIVLALTWPIAFTIAWGVAEQTGTLTLCPVFMVSLMIATSQSYCLVMLARYREGLLERQRRGLAFDGIWACLSMLAHSGQTVLVSSATLAVCFLGLGIFRLGALRSIGVCCGLVVTITTLACGSVCPLCLLVFKSFWEKSSRSNPWWDYYDRFWDRCCVQIDQLFQRCRRRNGDPAQSPPLSLRQRDDHSDCESDWNDSNRNAWVPGGRRGGVDEEGALIYESDNVDRHSHWYCVGMLGTSFPWNLIVLCLVVGATSPVDARAAGFQMTAGVIPRLPRSGTLTLAAEDAGAVYGLGVVWPSFFLISLPGEAALNWSLAQAVVQRIADRIDRTTLDRFDSALVLDGKLQDYGDLSEAEKITYINGNKIWARFRGDFEPMSSSGRDWLKDIRSEAATIERETGVAVEVSGVPAEELDAMDSVIDDYPVVLSVTGAVALGVATVAFRSVLIPVRAVAVRAAAVAFVYGFAELVYTKGSLGWLNIDAFSSDADNEIVYANPLAALPIIVGIGLGFDFMLTSRVVELRMQMLETAAEDTYEQVRGDETGSAEGPQHGVAARCAACLALLRPTVPTKRAIIIGVCRTGSTVSAAGLVMFVAFAGLLFSDTPAVNQLTFYLVAAILFDVFVSATLIVPNALALTGELIWWPAALREPPSCPCPFRSSADE
eukprot:TRINITY_DN70105_c0_g1_i1.p1 TRINITY_DN70105_c0_g1~~TRINITY_DN70105_c0_g1_i1.p1  ORF type:complete len:1047 (+),score=330.88 TRINITY_DN70105_c0_g1_i1:76-3141(+)